MKTISYINWCNENEGRAYPIVETATRVDDAGVRLPDDFIVDMGILLPAIYSGLRISTIYVSTQLVCLSISSDSGGLLTGSFIRNSIVPYTSYPLTGVVDNVSGWVTFGNFNITRQHSCFATAAQSGLEARAIRVVSPPGVTRFQRLNGDASIYATDIVKLKASSEFIIELDPENSQNILVRLTPEVRQRYTQPCTGRTDSEACGVPVIRRINNVPANAEGQITLRFT